MTLRQELSAVPREEHAAGGRSSPKSHMLLQLLGRSSCSSDACHGNEVLEAFYGRNPAALGDVDLPAFLTSFRRWTGGVAGCAV
jgi:hypothetical protein